MQASDGVDHPDQGRRGSRPVEGARASGGDPTVGRADLDRGVRYVVLGPAEHPAQHDVHPSVTGGAVGIQLRFTLPIEGVPRLLERRLCLFQLAEDAAVQRRYTLGIDALKHWDG